VVTGGSGQSPDSWESLAADGSKLTFGGSLSGFRSGHSSVALKDGRVLLVGGDVQPAPLTLLNPTTGAHLDLPLQAQLGGVAVGQLDDGSLLLLGGRGLSGAPLSSVTRYTPASDGSVGAFAAMPSMTVARSFPNVTTHADGRLLVLGGLGVDGDLNTVEAYDPALGAWQLLGWLQLGREGPTLTPLVDGGLLVVGGRVSGAAVASAERCADGLCAATSCTTKAQCDPGQQCLQGTCAAPLPNGKTCSSGADCASTICTQGLCCESTCDGPCVSCNAADKQGSPSGVCGPVGQGLDPHNQCSASGGQCGSPGVCDGLGSCAGPRPFGQSCSTGGPQQCVDGVILGSGCDGKGTCGPVVPQYTCAPAKVCDGAACGPNTCTSSDDCAGANVCVGGRCAAMQGASCNADDACATGHCSQGVCCDKPCDGACETCGGASSGTCKLRPAGPVTTCSSLACACSAATCDGLSSTPKLPDGSTLCSTSVPVCGADGASLVTKTGVCTGSGSCDESTPETQTVSCFPYACDPLARACTKYCGSTLGPCAAGAHCVSQKCVPDAVDAGPPGSGIDAGAVAVEPAAAAASDGCSVRGGSSPAGSAAWLVVALAALVVRRRRRDDP
jgi:MYXO-CTERM domain-containing protein